MCAILASGVLGWLFGLVVYLIVKATIAIARDYF
jgi:hypothetical protein